MLTKFKIIGIFIGIFLICCCGVFFQHSLHKKVIVVPVTDLSTNMGNIDEVEMQGTITSQVSQKIDYDEEKKVKEIYVKKGEKVKKGDLLLTYDMSLSQLTYEMKKLDKENILLSIKKTQQEINKLKTNKTSNHQTPLNIQLQDEKTENSVSESEKNEQYHEKSVKRQQEKIYAVATTNLDGDSKPYIGSGSEDFPYRYLVSQKGHIEGSFINKMISLKQFFVIETREGDNSFGGLLKIWGGNSNSLVMVNDEDEFNMSLQILPSSVIEKDIPPAEMLSLKSIEEKQWIRGNGSDSDPFIFLIKQKGFVRGDFLNEMMKRKASFRIEVRKDNENKGIIMRSWEQNGLFMSKCNDDELFEITLHTSNAHKNESQDNYVTEPAKIENKASYDVEYVKTFPTNNFHYRTLSQILDTDNEGINDKEEEIRRKEAELREYQVDLKEVNYELEKMNRQLETSTVVSNLNGTVKKAEDLSGISKSESTILLITSNDGMYVTGEVLETQLDKIQKGSILKGLSLEENIEFTAEVQEISEIPMEDEQDNNSKYRFIAYISDAKGLKNDDQVSLFVVDKINGENSTIVLEKPFVRFENGKYYVMKRSKNTRIKKQFIHVSKIIGDNAYEIDKGLSLNDEIAFPYGKWIKEGVKTKSGSIDDLY